MHDLRLRHGERAIDGVPAGPMRTARMAARTRAITHVGAHPITRTRARRTSTPTAHGTATSTTGRARAHRLGAVRWGRRDPRAGPVADAHRRDRAGHPGAGTTSYAARNRQLLADRGIFALNLVSSPGSGKTTLLVRTIEALRGSHPGRVIEGDQQTSLDADRIRATGAAAIQLNTGKGCHLDAHMVGHALAGLDPAEGSLLHDRERRQSRVPGGVRSGRGAQGRGPLGDRGRGQAAQVSRHVPRGGPHAGQQDRPRAARATSTSRRPSPTRAGCGPALEVVELSATTGEGFGAWIAWLERGSRRQRRRASEVAGLRGASRSWKRGLRRGPARRR